MKEDIALAGFVLTAEEWQAFDPTARAQLMAVASRREEAQPKTAAMRMRPPRMASARLKMMP